MKATAGWYGGYDDPTLWENQDTLASLDEIKVAGVADLDRLENLSGGGILSQLIRILRDPAELTFVLRPDANEIAEKIAPKVTAKKYEPHLFLLDQWGVLEEIPQDGSTAKISHRKKNEMWPLVICSYFCIAKPDGSGRTIFNGKVLSLVCKDPLPVNLLEIQELLLLLAELLLLGPVSIVLSDYRHWFHQLKVNHSLSRLFGILCSDRHYLWIVLPMGWLWSPVICQGAGYIVILHTTPSDPYFWDLPKSLVGLPRFVRCFKKGKVPEYVGFVSLLYDNVGAFFIDDDIARAFVNRFKSTLEFTKVQTKYLNHYTSKVWNGRSPDRLAEIVYRGIQLTYEMHRGKRILHVRADPSKKEKWKALEINWEGPIRTLIGAKVVGVVLWAHSLRTWGLCRCSNTIAILRIAAKEGWKKSTIMLSISEREILKTTLAWVIKNPFTPIYAIHTSEEIWVATDASDIGWGSVVIGPSPPSANVDDLDVQKGKWTKKSGSLPMIFLRELLVAIYTVRRYLKHRVHIILLEDNSAARFALSNRYSSNELACKWLQDRDEEVMAAEARLTVLPVKSEDNCSDAPSRDDPMIMSLVQLNHRIAAVEKEGGRLSEPHAWKDRKPRTAEFIDNADEPSEEKYLQEAMDDLMVISEDSSDPAESHPELEACLPRSLSTWSTPQSVLEEVSGDG